MVVFAAVTIADLVNRTLAKVNELFSFREEKTMTEKQARELLRNTVVIWNNDPDDLGTVRKLSSTAFFVDWANGQDGWVDYRDAKKISVR